MIARVLERATKQMTFKSIKVLGHPPKGGGIKGGGSAKCEFGRGLSSEATKGEGGFPRPLSSVGR